MDNEQLKELALEAVNSFEHKKRDNGDDFTCLKNDAPDWIREAISDIHGTDILPDDWRYDKIYHCFDALSNYNSDDWDDYGHEISSNLVDIYNYDRIKWITNNNTDDINEAMEEMGRHDFISGVGYAQQQLISGFVYSAINLIRKQIED